MFERTAKSVKLSNFSQKQAREITTGLKKENFNMKSTRIKTTA
jgi:hypothetical protein